MSQRKMKWYFLFQIAAWTPPWKNLHHVGRVARLWSGCPANSPFLRLYFVLQMKVCFIKNSTALLGLVKRLYIPQRLQKMDAEIRALGLFAWKDLEKYKTAFIKVFLEIRLLWLGCENWGVCFLIFPFPCSLLGHDN